MTSLLLFLVGLFAQSSAVTPKFDVASIKPSDPGGRGRSVLMPPDDNMLSIRGMTLRELIQFCGENGTGLHSALISGGPGWFDQDRFDVMAKSEGRPIPPQSERKEMLKAVLSERFQLKYHREPRMTGVYALVLGKNGSKMKLRTADDGGAPFSLLLNGFHLPGRNASMAEIANILQSIIPLTDPERDDRPVLDRTGLPGRFDFELRWSPEKMQAGGDPGSFTAVQDQLGLKLEMQKISMDVLVIDRAEKPSEN